MQYRTFLLLFVCCAGVALAEDATLTPDELVDRVITSPRGFHQMCLIPPPLDPEIPFSPYGMVLRRSLYLYGKDYEDLHARREEVVPVLVHRLSLLDLNERGPSRGKVTLANDLTITQSGVSPYQLSGLLFESIIALDAVETLPELLRLEDQLTHLLEAAEDNEAIQTPATVQDGLLILPNKKHQSSNREHQLILGRVTQRELCSLILQLLRRQRFQPLLNSAMEKNYSAALKAGKTTQIRFTPKVREQVRAWARRFIKEVQPEKWIINPQTPEPS